MLYWIKKQMLQSKHVLLLNWQSNLKINLRVVKVCLNYLK
jgi:hypothetical protein